MAHRRKRSVSFAPELDARIEAAATAAGVTVSAWLSRCAEDRLINEDGLRAMQEYEAMFGPLPADALASADAEIDGAFAAADAAHRKLKARTARGAA